MTTSSARTSVKNRLGISVTTWDTIIDDFVTEAVNRLYPKAMLEVSPQTSNLTIDSYGESNSIDLSGFTTPLVDVRKVDVTTGTYWFPADSFYRHNNFLTIRELDTTVTQAKLYGLARYSITNVPAELELAIIWFAMSEFFEYLASNKANYNIYSQTNGARGVDNMRDEALFYEQKAEAFLDEHATMYGS